MCIIIEFYTQRHNILSPSLTFFIFLILFNQTKRTLLLSKCTILFRFSIVFCMVTNWPQVGHDVSRLGHCTRCPSAPLINRTSCNRPYRKK